MLDEILALIKEARPKTTAGRSIPISAPDGWVHLSVAVARIAQALVQDEECGLSGAFGFALELTELAPTGDPELDAYRSQLADQIVEFVTRSCHQGHLHTGYRRIGGGEVGVRPIGREWWDGLEDPFAPFRTWGYDPDNPMSPDPPNWIWVSERHLITQEARIQHIGDADKALPGVNFGEGGDFEAIPILTAIEVLKVALPLHSDGLRHATECLVELCATGAVKSLAGHMFRSVRADENGLNGQVVEAVPTWPIPARLWKLIEDSPLQDWKAGELIVCDDPDSFRLRRVHVDRVTLMRSLVAKGLVAEVSGIKSFAWARLLDEACWLGFVPKNGAKFLRHHERVEAAAAKDTVEAAVSTPEHTQGVGMAAGDNGDAEDDRDPAVSRTRPKPFWYPKLRDEFILRDKREAELRLEGKTPPVFFTANQFRTRVAQRLGVPEDKIELEKVRYHLRALKKEFGRA